MTFQIINNTTQQHKIKQNNTTTKQQNNTTQQNNTIKQLINLAEFDSKYCTFIGIPELSKEFAEWFHQMESIFNTYADNTKDSLIYRQVVHNHSNRMMTKQYSILLYVTKQYSVLLCTVSHYM